MNNVYALPGCSITQPGFLPAIAEKPKTKPNYTALIAQQLAAVEWATEHQLVILNAGADVNGAYLNVAPGAYNRTLFDDGECLVVSSHTVRGLTTEIWMGAIELNGATARIFWREVSSCCAA